jgi:hypothetical protein
MAAVVPRQVFVGRRLAILLAAWLASAGTGGAHLAGSETTPKGHSGPGAARPPSAKQPNFEPSHWSDVFKDLPFFSSKLDVGGSVRYRFESQDNFNAKKYGNPDHLYDGFLLQRLRLDFDFRFRKDAHAFVEMQDSRPYGLDFTKEDFVLGCPYWDPFDLRKAYVEWHHLGGGPFGFKVGRQAIRYADNRIWGPGDWGNVGRYAWDAAKLLYEGPRADVDFIFGDQVRFDPYDFDGEHYKFHAYCIYASLKELPCKLDLFWVKKESRENYVVSPAGDTARLDVHTLGFHVDGKFRKHWDYRGTFAYQLGGYNGASVCAFGAHARTGYTLPGPYKPRLGFEYSHGSGDPNPGAGAYQTFDGVFGAIDMMYGRMNLFSWRNLHDYQTQLSIQPTEKTKIVLDWHFFELDRARDAWYYCNGRPQRQDPTGASGRALGHEIDLVARYQHDKYLELQAGYAHFFAGEFIHNTGPSPDADWVFVQLFYKL